MSKRVLGFIAALVLLVASFGQANSVGAATPATTALIDRGMHNGSTYSYGWVNHFLAIAYEGPTTDNRVNGMGGTVTWRDNGVVVGTTPAWGAYSHFDYTPKVGTHVLSARFNGDGETPMSPAETSTSFTVVKADLYGSVYGEVAFDKGGSTNVSKGRVGVTIQNPATPNDGVKFKTDNAPNLGGTMNVSINGDVEQSFSVVRQDSTTTNSGIFTAWLPYDLEAGGSYVIRGSYAGDADNKSLDFEQTMSFDKLYSPRPGGSPGCFMGTCGLFPTVGDTTVLRPNETLDSLPTTFAPTGTVTITDQNGRVLKTAPINSFRWEIPFTFTDVGRQCLTATWSGDKHYLAQDPQLLNCWTVSATPSSHPGFTPLPNQPKAAPAPVANASATSSANYTVLKSTGEGTGYGASGGVQTQPRNLNAPVVGGASTPGGKGFWSVAGDGGIITAGDAQFYGSTGNMKLNRPVIGMASTPSGKGYWLVAGDGGIFTFGDAAFHGSTGAMRLNAPIIGMTSTPSGNGYWLVAADGGIFTFGDAKFFGSTGNMKLNSPVLGMSSTPSGNGYWMVAADGGIFTFGDAAFYGSTGASKLNQPVVGMTATNSGKGYWLVARDGGVFTFGDAAYLGTNVSGPANAVAIISGR